MTQRTYWKASSLGVENEPLLLSLWKYRQRNNRVRVPLPDANLVSSITEDKRQRMILDLDFPHKIVPSSTPGHSHLYIEKSMSRWQWFWLMTALYHAGVIELGFYVWSVRRGGNFVRIPGSVKTGEAESTYSDYGWLFKRRKRAS